MDTRTPVVVIYRGGQGALAIARTLGRLGVPMYLVAQEERSTAVWASRYWSERSRWDFDKPQAASVEFLLELGRTLEARHGARPILLTLADWVAIFIEDHADALSRSFTFPKAETAAVRMLGNKWTMHNLALEHGIPTPQTVYPQSREEVATFLESAIFPVVMKAADAHLPHVPAKHIARDARELLDKFDRDSALGPPNLVLQEYIPGDVETVWMCNAYFGDNSRCHAVLTGKKLRQVSATGIASLAVCLPNETVAAQTKSFMQAAGYRGCVGIGYRYDARDGLYKVLDVNPRVSGIFRLFCATNGMDVVRICYLDLTGQPTPAVELSVGRKWLLEDDVFAALAAFSGRRLTVRQWLQSLRGVRETHWFAVDDPRPGLVWLWGMVRRGKRAGSRLGGRLIGSATA